MGDPRRFDLFASFIANLVPPAEPAPRRGGQVRRLGIRVQNFEPSFAKDFDLVVGMHPDAATDCILAGAALHGALAVVCPCCVRPNAWSYWGSGQSHTDWQSHLVARSAEAGLPLQVGQLKMTGANRIMWGQAR